MMPKLSSVQLKFTVVPPGRRSFSVPPSSVMSSALNEELGSGRAIPSFLCVTSLLQQPGYRFM